MGKIARQYGVRVSQVKQWNCLRSNNIRVGQRLTIYPRNAVNINSNGAKQSTKKKPTNKPLSTKGKTTYTVQEGDSLWSIALKFEGVSVDNLKEWNNIKGNRISIGMVLVAYSTDLIMLFVAWELMSIPTYILAGFIKKNPSSNEAALKYFLFGALASAIIIYGISIALVAIYRQFAL